LTATKRTDNSSSVEEKKKHQGYQFPLSPQSEKEDNYPSEEEKKSSRVSI
jgi:hypothetical protein